MTSLTNFLTELSESPELREAFQDERRREQLLEERGLERHPALQPGASLEDVRGAVADEQPGGEAGIEWWILVDSGPVENDSFSGASGSGPSG
jgi:hypothetical protein